MISETPIILVNNGCCISSFVNNTMCKLLRKHGIQFTQLGEMELYTPQKNPYYKSGMNKLDLLKVTFEKHNNIIMKLNYNLFQNKYIRNLLNKVKARICCFLRWNLLDILICRYKDFNDLKPEKYQSQKFNLWRKSDDRKNLKIPYKTNKIIKDLKILDLYYKNLKKNNKHIDFYYV